MAIRLSGLQSNMDTDSIVEALMSAHSLKKTKIENKITKLEWTQEKWKSLNSKMYSFYTGSVSKMRLQSSYNIKKATTSNSSVATVTASSSATNGSYSLQVNQLATSQYVTGGKIQKTDTTTATTLKELGYTGSGKITINGTEVEVEESTTISDFISKCRDNGVNASFDATQGRMFISSKESGSAGKFTIDGDSSALSALGLGTIDGTEVTASDEKSMTVVAAQNAEFSLNGAKMTSTSNAITVNGLSITLQEVTTNPVTITVDSDIDAVYDMIKGFVKDYNELLGEMNDCYYASSSRGYDPLTDDEKEAMSESEIEKWEDKIKSSLLRRDSKLYSAMSSMKNAMSGTAKVGGKAYSLSSLGITASVYTEKGKYHIDGNADDPISSGNKDKLRSMLETDPDTVMEIMSQLATEMYSSLQNDMKASTISSALTFYNDKQMDTLMTQYKKELSAMESKLQDLEDRYYSQFTAMETAMANLNSQSSYLSGLMGQ